MGTCYLLTEAGEHLVQEQGVAPHAILIDNCVHTPGVTAVVGKPGRVRRISHEQWEKEYKEQRQFSRQLWNETLEAEEKARARAVELERQGKAEEAQLLANAIEAAEQALYEAELRELRNDRQLRELKNALVSATKAKATEEQLKLAELKAIAFQKYIQEMEDEEESVILLIS